VKWKTFSKLWRCYNEFKTGASNNSLINGKICSHTLAMFTSKKLTAYKILQCLYVDDGAFPFGTREDLKKGMELVYHKFGRFGLEMHIK
jgi:hypothetical protein